MDTGWKSVYGLERHALSGAALGRRVAIRVAVGGETWFR